MEYIDQVLYRKINPSDFKKLYDIDRPQSGGGQTYLEAAGIANDDIVDFLSYAEISDSPLKDEKRSIYTFKAYVLGDGAESDIIEFAPRGGRANYRISRQTMKYKHPAWRPENGFPEPNKNSSGEYTSHGEFRGIIDDLVIFILRTTYRKYYAGFVNNKGIPHSWPKGIGLEDMFEGNRRGVVRFTKVKVQIEDSNANPFGEVMEGAAFLENRAEGNEYEVAAGILTKHVEENGVEFLYSNEEVQEAYDSFLSSFSPEKLTALSDDELLKTIFYSNSGNNDSLCYELEFQPQIKEMFGSVAGGSAYKFGLFQRKEDGIWMTGSGNKPKELSEDEALELGKKIRDSLVAGAELIGEKELNSKEDYEKLDEELNGLIGDYAHYGWIQKYYQMIYPDKLISFYTTDWHNHLLYALGIEPSDRYYGSNGQLAIVRQLTGLNNSDFADVVWDKFGYIKRFVRLGSNVGEEGYMADEWLQRGIVAIGWSEIGSLDEYRQGNTLVKKAVAEALEKEFYPNDSSTASRKAGEIQEFFSANENTIFVVMDGERSVGIVDDIGEYYFDPQHQGRAHCRPGDWHICFDKNEELPTKSEGKLTTCFEFKKTDNLMYLYRKYYYELEEVEDNAMSRIVPFEPLNYHTGIKSPFAANRIMFGAPGTGKSYRLEQDRKAVLEDGAIGGYERVTFHPDYAYSQFVGAYKPITDNMGNIRYQFVPGPFMRVYVEALRNGRTDNPEPYILLIEEINRANVAAVFGDVFQLLDRDGTNVSEYPIQTTEDIRNYLADQLGGTPDDYIEIKIPDNMFIWATMNSADQGVFPMDTAFKRRWDFTYLGIDNGEEKIQGKTVELGKGGHKKSIEWNELRKEINSVLLNDCKVNEDKLMGPFFIPLKNLSESDEIDTESFNRIFKNKVIMYLFDDAAKQKRPTLFDGCETKNLYSAICDEFEEKGVDIFSESVRSAFSIKSHEDEE